MSARAPVVWPLRLSTLSLAVLALSLGTAPLSAGAVEYEGDSHVLPLPEPIVVTAKSAQRVVMQQRRQSGPGFAEELIDLVNRARANDDGRVGVVLPPLKRVAVLDSIAQSHTDRMAYFDHLSACDPDTGLRPGDRLLAGGYLFDLAGESLVAGIADPAGVVAALLASPGHRVNLLSQDLREIGIGHVFDATDDATVRRDLDNDCTTDSYSNGPYHWYASLDFGLREEVFPTILNDEAYAAGVRDVTLYQYGESWAVEMRIRNEVDPAWPDPSTGWQPFASTTSWQLSAGEGLKEVFVDLRSAVLEIRSSSDTIILAAGIFSDDLESGDTTAWSSAAP